MKKSLIFWNKDFSNLIFREKKVNLDFRSRKAVAIVWPRRSWKTFYCFQMALELQKQWIPKNQIIYFNLEDERIKPFTVKDLNLILDVYFESFPENKDKQIYLFLDEVQEVENWEIFVRRILDETNINVILTGSSSKMLSVDIATTLRWRVISYEILPLSFFEVLKFNNFELKKYYSEDEKYKYKEIFNKVLKYWFFPEVVIEKDEEIKINILRNYYDVIFYKDVIERGKIKQIVKAKTFRRLLTSYNAKLISFSQLAKAVGIQETTCLNWYNQFVDAFFVTDLKKFDFSLKIQEKSKKKIYLTQDSPPIFVYNITNIS